MLQRLLGLTLGLVLGSSVVTYAQEKFTLIALDPDNAICWDQAAPSLDDARALNLEVSVDGSVVPSIPLVCNAGSPFECGFQIPVSLSSVGTRTFTYRVGNTELDGTISWNQPTSTTVEFVNKKGNPAQPSNPRAIRKKLIILLTSVGAGTLWLLKSIL